MRDLKFHYAAAKNFICFGPDGIELFFDKHGSLVLVKGENYDDGTEEGPASNGSGKSSLQDILSYALYGKTVKSPKQLYHGDVINTLSGKGLEVEVQFDDHRVVRSRKPNKLKVWKSSDQVWEDSTEVTMGTMAETQKYIETIVGLTHRAFCNIIVFDDSNAHCFLEADTPTKRQITENLLGLDQYREHHDSAKKLRNEYKSTVNDLSRDYERLVIEMEAFQTRIKMVETEEKNWKEGIQKKLKEFENEIAIKQKELENTDEGTAIVRYQEAQEEIISIQGTIDDLDHKRERIVGIVKEANNKLDLAKEDKQNINNIIQEHHLKIKSIENQMEGSSSLMSSLERLQEGQKCPTCHGVISKENYGNVLLHEQHIIEQSNEKIEKIQAQIERETGRFKDKSMVVTKLQSNIDEANKTMNAVESRISTNRQKLVELNKIKKPEGTSAQQILETKIVDLKKAYKSKEEELNQSPYKEIKESAINEKDAKSREVDEKKKEMKEAESLLPYVNFWVDAFGDKGIRKFVVDGAIPALNSRIAYWLQHLIDNKIELEFDNELEATVKRNGVDAHYYSMSNGEKRRINLAVSQAFSYVMMLHSGSCPSLVFLDEITGGGIDRVGVIGVYNMVFELAKERQVFVTTHNENLLDMLEGCENITLCKRDDITKLVS